MQSRWSQPLRAVNGGQYTRALASAFFFRGACEILPKLPGSDDGGEVRGVGSPRFVQGRRPRTLLPHREHRSSRVTDRSRQSRLQSMPSSSGLSRMGHADVPGLRRVGRADRGGTPSAPAGSSPRGPIARRRRRLSRPDPLPRRDAQAPAGFAWTIPIHSPPGSFAGGFPPEGWSVERVIQFMGGPSAVGAAREAVLDHATGLPTETWRISSSWSAKW
jgi:hypothetical protein